MKIVVGIVGFVIFVGALMFGARALDAPASGPLPAQATAPQPASPPRAQPRAQQQAQQQGQPQGQQQAPPLPPLFVVKDATDPTPIALAGPRKKPALLHLWASWCGPCIAELPSLLALGRQGAFDVIAVSVDDRWPDVVRFFKGQIPPEVTWDPKVTLEPTLGVRSLPTTFLVDTQGRVRTRLTGSQDWASADLVAGLTGLLATPP